MALKHAGARQVTLTAKGLRCEGRSSEETKRAEMCDAPNIRKGGTSLATKTRASTEDLLTAIANLDDHFTSVLDVIELARAGPKTPQDEGASFEMSVFCPLEAATFSTVADSITAIERRMRLAVILTFLEPDREQFPEINALLEHFPGVPLSLSGLTLASLKITVRGTPEEIDRLLHSGREDHRLSPWVKRLLVAISVCFHVVQIVPLIPMDPGTDIGPLPVPTSAVQELAKTGVEAACGLLPAGTEITVKTAHLELKFPCPERKEAE